LTAGSSCVRRSEQRGERIRRTSAYRSYPVAGCPPNDCAASALADTAALRAVAGPRRNDRTARMLVAKEVCSKDALLGHEPLARMSGRATDLGSTRVTEATSRERAACALHPWLGKWPRLG